MALPYCQYAIHNEWYASFFLPTCHWELKNLYILCTGFAAYISPKTQGNCPVYSFFIMPAFSRLFIYFCITGFSSSIFAYGKTKDSASLCNVKCSFICGYVPFSPHKVKASGCTLSGHTVFSSVLLLVNRVFIVNFPFYDFSICHMSSSVISI